MFQSYSWHFMNSNCTPVYHLDLALCSFSDIAAVLVSISDWIRYLCGIQLTGDKRAMKSITKQQALEFKDRWKFVNDFIAHEIRNTPAETKLRQLSVMFVVGQSRSAAFLSEEQEVRNRWRLLKQKANV